MTLAAHFVRCIIAVSTMMAAFVDRRFLLVYYRVMLTARSGVMMEQTNSLLIETVKADFQERRD
jgi:hypothetical protein